MFFESYTEKVWGRHPREISPEWGAQRIKEPGPQRRKLINSPRKRVKNIKKWLKW